MGRRRAMVDVDDDRIRLDGILELNRWRKGRREEETRRALLAFWRQLLA